MILLVTSGVSGCRGVWALLIRQGLFEHAEKNNFGNMSELLHACTPHSSMSELLHAYSPPSFLHDDLLHVYNPLTSSWWTTPCPHPPSIPSWSKQESTMWPAGQVSLTDGCSRAGLGGLSEALLNIPCWVPEHRLRKGRCHQWAVLCLEWWRVGTQDSANGVTVPQMENIR